MKFAALTLLSCLGVGCVGADADVGPTESSSDILVDGRYGQYSLRNGGHFGAPSGQFAGGMALSTDGLWLAIAQNDGTHGTSREPRSVAIFHRVHWSQAFSGQPHQVLQAPNGYNAFGTSLGWADDGGTLAVGGRYVNGLVTIYSRVSSTAPLTTVQTLVLTEPNQTFGASVAWAGPQRLFVGDVTAGGRGAVYIYLRQDIGAQFVAPSQTLSAPTANNASFGRSIAASSDGRTLAVGDDRFGNGAGAVHIFAPEGQGYGVAPYDTITLSNDAYFGDAIALSADGNELLTGGSAGRQGSTVQANGLVHGFLRQENGHFPTRPQQSFQASTGFGRPIALGPNAMEFFAFDAATVSPNGTLGVVWHYVRYQP